MKHLLLATALLLLTGMAQAATLTGSLADPNQVAEFNFTLTLDNTVSIWTQSGWTQDGSQFFDPTLALWQYDAAAADWLLLTTNDDAAVSYGSSNSFDSGLTLNLFAGDYLATITGSMNAPFGPYLSDGFNGNGAGNIPNNIGNFTLHIDGANVVVAAPSVPEPAAIALLAFALPGFSALRRTKKRA